MRHVVIFLSRAGRVCSADDTSFVPPLLRKTSTFREGLRMTQYASTAAQPVHARLTMQERRLFFGCVQVRESFVKATYVLVETWIL